MKYKYDINPEARQYAEFSGRLLYRIINVKNIPKKRWRLLKKIFKRETRAMVNKLLKSRDEQK